MTFVSQIQEMAESLTPSEKRLVTSVLEEPRRAALATVSELARAAGVHEATVTRLTRKLGFDGFPAFRQALQDEFIPQQETATRLQRTIEDTEEAGILSTLLSQETEALSRVCAQVSEDQIADVARRLVEASRIYVYGRGNAEILALMMAKRFRRFGRDVHLLPGDPRELAERVVGMRPGDVVLGYVFRRPPRHYAALIEHAREAGAATIVISGTSGHLMVPAPDLMLTAPRAGHAEGFQTLTVPMAISNAIVIAAGAQLGDESLKTLEKLGELIKRFD